MSSTFTKKFKDIVSNIKTIGPKEDPTRYSVAKLLGQGQYGAVYIGYDNQNQSIALKFLSNKKDYEKERDCLKHIKKVCGKYILCYIDDFSVVINETFVYCIITEYIAGYKVFSNYIEENLPLKKETTDKILNNIATALEIIHGIQVEHMDLHEDNILIDPETLNVKLIDFGRCDIFEEGLEELFEALEDESSLRHIRRTIEKMNLFKKEM